MKTKVISLFMVILLTACNQSGATESSISTPESGLRKFPFISDVSRYQEVMDSFEKHPFLDHFPKEIPPEASNVRFAYEPKMMQGAMIVELLMTLPNSEINDLWSQYSGLEKYEFIEDKILKDIPEPILFLIRNENYELNQNFSIFFIDAQPAGKEDFIWNHGTMYGVGINKSDLEVVYFLQYW